MIAYKLEVMCESSKKMNTNVLGKGLQLVP